MTLKHLRRWVACIARLSIFGVWWWLLNWGEVLLGMVASRWLVLACPSISGVRDLERN
jgi:hypothetical protein